MENKEIKNTTAKLEDVNGGLLKPIILDVEDGRIGRNLELSDDALNTVAGGCVSVESAPFESSPYLCQCPKCGRSYEAGSSCLYCLIQESSLSELTYFQQ